MNLIEAQNLRVHLGHVPVVRDLSITVKAGEITGLIGPNGAGKSTLIKALAGFLEPEAGQVLLQDRPLGQWKAYERAQRIGYLPQGGRIHWPLIVERAVELGRIPHQAAWQPLSESDHAAVRDAMKQTDIASLADRRVDTLAGGERTLVMLARVLAGNPLIVLADEPVAGLDPNHQLQVMELFASLAAAGRTVLVVLHDLSLAARFCQKLYFMKAGCFIASGSPQEVLTAENLKTGYSIEARLTSGPDGLGILPWKRL
ncbi:MAG: ABC transporter ATP-binding protein [Candidatus Omnitrophica bacterium]|nr:ABC transporter ATP-binding protein [Candidatus Omnitrophota bacterium]